jgi:hypothetical protein
VHLLRIADALERALLQHAEQLGLQLERDLRDLVEEQRAVAGELENRPGRSATAPVNAPFT